MRDHIFIVHWIPDQICTMHWMSSCIICAGVTAGLGICAGITLLHIKRAVIGSKARFCLMHQGTGPPDGMHVAIASLTAVISRAV